jgi:hypothetical protein
MTLTHDPLKEIRRKTLSNLWNQPKNENTKEENREELKQALMNHAESSIHTMKVHTRSSFCPIILLVRHGYPWVPTDQAHGRPRQVGLTY